MKGVVDVTANMILSIIFFITPIDGLCYKVMDSSIMQYVFHL